MPEDPRIADGTPRDPDDIHPGLPQHPHGIFGGEYVTAAEDGLIGIFLFEIAQKRPSRTAGVFLFHRPAVDANRRETQRPRGFNNLKKAILRLGRIIKPAPQTHRQRCIRKFVAHRAHNGFTPRHIQQHMAAARLVLDLLHRAGKVEIDHIVTGIMNDPGGFRHRLRLAPHDLPGEGMILIIQIDGATQPLAAVEHDDVEQRFGDGITATAPARHQPHCAVTVTSQASLAERGG